ncbi:MAG TPA: 3-deoxy-7-phosphoheptulonate synthase [Dehalococcoidia bacterium]|nr:3-deoxy-7-phosphoheptulonate synthase [Dehalococcoidia bacterium]
MIVVMKQGAAEHVPGVIERLTELGFDSHPIVGAERSVVAVIGQVYPELQDELEVLPGVHHVLRVSSPYKLTSREVNPDDTVVEVRGVRIGGTETVIMAGPCTVETEQQLMTTARHVAACGANVMRGGAFKPRTNPHSFQGLGEAGLELLSAARDEVGLPIVTEVLDPRDVELVARYADILQIGARNAQNFPLLREVGRSQKPVLLKRGLTSMVEEWLLAAEYIITQGNRNVMLCERGIRTFETATRFTLDISAIALARELSHLPVICDPSHATGKASLVPAMGLAAIAAGANGLIVDVHPSPDHALIDGPQSLDFDTYESFMSDARTLAESVHRPLLSSTAVPA